MNSQASKYTDGLRVMGPVAWAKTGWAGVDGPVQLAPWQEAVLQTWFDHRSDITTLGVSNIKKTGKTWLTSVLTAWRWLALPGVHFCAANDQEQAMSRVFSEIADMCRRDAFLKEYTKLSKSELEFTLTGSRLVALASDAAGNAGANFITASVTEAWAIQHEASVRNWDELTSPPGLTYGLPALRIADSYAGYVSESKTWHALVDRGLTGARVSDWPIYRRGGLLLFHDEGEHAQETCFRGTEAERIDYYDEQKESLRPSAYIRLHLNQRTSGEASFVSDEQWQACYSEDVRPIYPGEQVKLHLGADASQRHDNTALIGVTKDEHHTDVRFVKVWKPAKQLIGSKPIDLEKTIGAEVLRLHKAGQVADVTYDPWQMAVIAQQWKNAGINVIELPQTAQRIEADSALADAITSGQLRHFKNADLDEAVRNAYAKETDRGLRIVKEKATKKIDALVALSMANHSAVTQPVGTVSTMPDPWDDPVGFEEYLRAEKAGKDYLGPQEPFDFLRDTSTGQNLVRQYQAAQYRQAEEQKTIDIFYKSLNQGKDKIK